MAKKKKPKPKKKKAKSDNWVSPRLIRKVKKSGYGIALSSPVQEKMSDILLKFGEPVLKDLDTEHTYKAAIALLALCWNLALIPEKDRVSHIDDLIENSDVLARREDASELRAHINMLLERKRKYFFDINRFIYDYDLRPTREGWHLSVASTPIEPEAETAPGSNS